MYFAKVVVFVLLIALNSWLFFSRLSEKMPKAH